MSPSRVFRIGEVLLGAAVLVLGLFVAGETYEMPATVAAAGGGPKLFPFVVAAGLAIVGGWLLFAAFGKTPREGQPLELDWPPVATVALGFVVLILSLELVGWIVAGTILFAAGAHAFGNRRHLSNVLIGIALTGLTYAVFDYGLGLDLPVGSLLEPFVDPADDGT